MSLTTDTQRKRALKTVSGKANTLNTKSIFEESISTIVPTHKDHVFAETVPEAASNPSLYQINGSCEYVRFELEYIADTGSSSFWTVDPESQTGNNQVVLNGDVNNDNDPGVEYVQLPSSYDGRHSYAVKLPADYLDNSSNPKKDRIKYQNGAKLHESNFKLQIVGLQHGANYYPKLFTGVGVGAVEVPQDDRRDWIFDSASGLVFQQNPPGPGDFPTNPTYLEGWLYIGDFLDEHIDTLSGSIATDIDTIQEDIVDLQNGGSSATTAIENDLVVKKLLGKAHTSPNKRHYNEAIASYIYSNASHIPSAAPPVIGTTPYPFYHIEDNKVEYLRLSGSYVDSGQSVDGRHGIKLHLPNDYVAQSSNAKKGSGFWFNGQSIHGTSGSIQLVPPYFNDNDSNYEGTAYFMNSQTNALEVIPPEDERNWHIDYQAGIIYQDTPEDTADLDPVFVDAWVWVGGMVSEGVGTGAAGLAGGGGTGDGTIGAAEDGTYTDGLFTDFSESTQIGTAVDRFNEVLKALAPNPAPAMREINYNVLGGSQFSGKLSFDGTHQSGAYPFASVETYTQQNEAGFDPLTVNDVYQADSKVVADANFDGSDLYFYKAGVLSGNNVRVEGTINFTVPAKVTANGVRQYENDVFGDGDNGTLYLELNGVNIHNINLGSTIGTGSPPNGSDQSVETTNGSGFIRISEPSPSQTEGGVSFPIFQSRSADFIVEAESMRPGHNKVRVKHNKGTVEYVSNYVEWVWDNTTDQITFANSNVVVQNQQGSVYISGVQYHTSLELRYSTDILNAYKPIYSTGNITTNSTVGTSNPLPLPLVANGEDMEKVINFTNDISINGASEPLINDTVDMNVTVPHPIRGDSTGGDTQSQSILLYNPTASATQTIEDFTLEDYRIQSDTYLSQGAPVSSGFNGALLWDSELHMTGSNAGHEDGLQIWTGKLVSPINSINTPNVGDFRSLADGGTLVTYDNNPNYSVAQGDVTGVRTYYRYFRNITNFDQQDFRIIYRGDTTLIGATDSFGVDKIKVSIKLPQTDSGQSTGWMDANSPFTMFNYGDNDGGYILPTGGVFDSNIGSNNSINFFTVGQKVIKPDEYVIVRIQADTNWTGNLDYLEVQWGASAAGNTAPGALPAVNELIQIDANQSGVSAKLSFGQTHVVANYTNVTNVHAGVGGTDVNELYSPNSNTLGIFASTNIDGDTQPQQSLRILDGHLGELILEINGVEEAAYSLDFTNFSLAGDHRIAGTGFYDVSEALPITYSNGLPNYSKIYRNVKYAINSNDQQEGHNYVRVIHRIGAEDRITNYIDWVIDPNQSNLQIVNAEMDDWIDNNTVYMSGIKYFESPSTTVRYTVEKLYETVYSARNDAAGWINLTRIDLTNNEISGTGIDTKIVTTDTTSLPNLNKTALCHLQDVLVEATGNWTGASKVLPGTYGVNSNQTASIRGQIYHPLKFPAGETTALLSKTNFLINTITNSSNDATNENFSSEDYRIPDQTYQSISDVTSASWDSTQSVLVSPYDNGLVQYNGYLIAPSKAGANGDFRSVGDGGIYQGPAGNVDYSNVTSQVTERVYMRPYYNNSSSDTSVIDILIEGSGQLSSQNLISNPSGPIGANNRFKLFVKLIEGGSGLSNTEWLDCGEAWTTQNGLYEGASMMGLNNLGVTLSSNSFVKVQFPNGWNFLKNASVRNYLIIKVVAHKQWTGHITRLGWRLG